MPYKCHTFDPKLPWFCPVSMGVLMPKPQGYEMDEKGETVIVDIYFIFFWHKKYKKNLLFQKYMYICSVFGEKGDL